MFRKSLFVPLSILLVIVSSFASDNKADLPKRAIERSQLTLPGSQPFHARVQIVEATNLENDSYKAEIEEYWVAPDRWRRTIKAPEFSQTLTVNGDKKSEEITGNYYPNWLRTLVDAIFEPGLALQDVDMSKSSDNPEIGGSLFCRRFTYRTGIAPVTNNVFSTICFKGDKLESVQRPGYEAKYKDYKNFAGKQVARSIREYIESGTELEAKVTELTELSTPDESLFALATPSTPVQTIKVSEQTLRKLADDNLELHWPPVKAGKTDGVLSLYVCLDRQGKVQEVYALNSDHPEMSDAARNQLAAMKFKPADFHGDQVQIEGILTFHYATKIEDPYPELSNDEARKLAIEFDEPSFPHTIARGTILSLSIFVAEDGKVHTSGAFKTADGQQLNYMYGGISKWRFKLPEKNGKATPFTSVLKFRAQ